MNEISINLSSLPIENLHMITVAAIEFIDTLSAPQIMHGVDELEDKP